MSDLANGMSAKDCRAAADYLEDEIRKLRLRENYPVIREQVERLAGTVRMLRDEAEEKEREG